MSHPTRIAGSFAIVVIAYWAYALLAVPWIEPPELKEQNGGNQAGVDDPVEDRVGIDIKQLEKLFPPGSWELRDPIILRSDRAKLLLQEYRNMGNGRVEIHPCTIVFPYEGDAENEDQRQRQSIVLEAPDGAVLQFDKPLDLGRASVGRLVGGQLKGKVTIRSDWKQPGPADDLLISTHDIQLSEQKISTPNPVEFRWGTHFGSGRDMLIKLLSGKTNPDDPIGGPNVAGIESFEMGHIDRLHVDLGQEAGKGASTPVEITCRGPFRFNVVRRVATFHDGVDVRKLNLQGPADQIACELLSLYFVSPPQKKPAPANPQKVSKAAAGSFDLVAERFEALGNPVVVTAPSENLQARGPRIEYNLLSKSIAMDGGGEVFLQRGVNEIHARSLNYESAGEGRMGLVTAVGPGWLRGQSDDRPGQVLEAAWNNQLRVFPRDRSQVISLDGGAELKYPGVGQLLARDISFFLIESPAIGGKSQLRPERMTASDNVRLRSSQLATRVDQLEVSFSEGAGGQGSEARGQGPGVGGQGPGERPATAVAGGGGVSSENPSSSSSGLGQVEVTGRVLRANVLLGQQTALTELSIDGGVQLVEAQTSQGQRPLVIRGDRLNAARLSSSEGVVSVVGRPARFEGRGLGLTGSNINLDRGNNRLWIAGPGQMDIPMAADLQGRPLADAAVLTVDWQGSMNFDGAKAAFDDSVVAAAPRLQSQAETMQFELRTAKMDVQLRRPIRFANPKLQEPPQVESIQCFRGVAMDNRTFDAGRQMAAFERLAVADLNINVLSGELTAGGPGWLNSVRRGSGNPFGREAQPVAARPNAVGDELHCLHIKFQGPVRGNLLRRQLAFHEQVRTSYGPVGSWDAMLTSENPDQLGPRGVAVRCDRLSVVEMLLPVGGRRAVELEALGNTTVENTTFIARGNRITYTEAKDLLILEGGGLNNAELWRQTQVGNPALKTAAKKIWYWPKTNRLSVDGTQILEIGQVQGLSR